jgi:translation initiation factor IF-1
MDHDEQELDIETAEGRVIEALPSTLFRVEMNGGKSLISYLGGRMRVHKIKVLVGDKVLVQIDPYGGKGRIIKRL